MSAKNLVCPTAGVWRGGEIGTKRRYSLKSIDVTDSDVLVHAADRRVLLTTKRKFQVLFLRISFKIHFRPKSYRHPNHVSFRLSPCSLATALGEKKTDFIFSTVATTTRTLRKSNYKQSL